MTRGIRRLKLSKAADMWISVGVSLSRASMAVTFLALAAFAAGVFQPETGMLVVALVLAGVVTLLVVSAFVSYVVFRHYEKLWDATFDSGASHIYSDDSEEL